MRRRISPQTVARYSALHPWRTIGLWVVLVVAAFGLIGTLLPGALTAQYSFINKPGSQKGADLLSQRMGMPQKAHEIVVVSSPTQTATSPAFRQEVLGLQSRIAALGPGVVDSVVSAYRGGSPAAMISADGRTAIIPIVMAGDVVKAGKNIDKVHAIVNGANGSGGFQTLITGTASINSDFSHQATTDLRKGEGIGMPIAIVILLIVFGTVVAASLPIFLALIAITLAVALTAILGHLFSVSIFAVNMITLIGLAVGIDYSLFIVSRFREELTHGRSTIDAVAVAGGTAARAVFFSGMTVVLALCALLVVPTNIFVSLGAGAILVVGMAVFAALTLLPAVLGLLGPRVNRLRLPYLGRRLMEARAVRQAVGAGAGGEGRHAAARDRALRRGRRPAPGRLAAVRHEDRRLRREHPAEQLRVQAGVRRGEQPVLGRPREPRADRDRRAGGLAAGAGRRAAAARHARRRQDVRSGAGSDQQGRRPDAAAGADRRLVDQQPGPRQGARAARHLHPAGVRRQPRPRST